MRSVWWTGLTLLLWASEARADLVYLQSGRTMSVRSIRGEGGTVVLELRGGGEIVCDRSLIVKVLPDEVPYPEPVPVVTEVGEDGEAAVVGTASIEDVDGGVDVLHGPVPYEGLIDRSSAKHGVDGRLIRAVIKVESGFESRARSRKGAMGLMQLMPDTARRYSVRRPYDPASNIDAGTRHLRSLLDRFPLDQALAAYNAGEAAVARFHGIPPFPETRDYVRRILKLIRTSADKQ